jgi:hypothetical protein
MNDSFKDQGNPELLPQGRDGEVLRGGENTSFECTAPVAIPTRCELFEGGLGI